jgi:hypothetical protein
VGAGSIPRKLASHSMCGAIKLRADVFCQVDVEDSIPVRVERRLPTHFNTTVTHGSVYRVNPKHSFNSNIKNGIQLDGEGLECLQFYSSLLDSGILEDLPRRPQFTKTQANVQTWQEESQKTMSKN